MGNPGPIAAAQCVAKEDIVELLGLHGEDSLCFPAPPINVALIRDTTTGSDGDISLQRGSLSLEYLSLAMVVRNSGGIVIFQVERVAQLNSIDARHVHVPGFMVDCIVLAEPEYKIRTRANSSILLSQAKSAFPSNHSPHYR